MSNKYRIIPIGGGGLDPTTKYGASIAMSLDNDYVLSVQLLDQDGNTLGTEQTVDLPLESVVVNGSYDSQTKSIILTLENGNTVTIPVGDLVSGLQTEITAQNPLSADLITDGTNNKVYTASEQTKLSGIQAGAQVNPANVSAFNNDAGYITQESVIINQAFPSGWHTSGTLSQLITDINADNTAVKGKSYLSTVSFSDLPGNLVQGEMTVQIMDEMAGTGKVILFTLTSSSNAPYHWEYTSAWGGTSQWREWALSTDVVNADWNATSGKAEILNKPSIPAAQVNSDWNATSGKAEILNKPSIPSKTSDLQNDSGFITSSDIPAQVQADWNESGPSQPAYIKNKPTIPAAQVNSDWNASTGVAQILNKPSIPANTSDLHNDSGFITANDIPAQVQSDWSEIDISDPAYIKNKPTIPAAQVNSDWNATSGKAEILNKPTIPTATSDLNNDSGFITANDVPAQQQSDWNESDSTKVDYIKNKPSIPANTSDLNNDSGFITSSDIPAQVNADWNAVSGAAQILNKPTIPAAQVNSDWNASTGVAQILNKPSIPANTSDLNNDSGFITSSDIPAQVNADWNASSGAAEILNKPTIPTVNDATLTIQKNGTSVGTFTANQATDETINITVPTSAADVSALSASTKYAASMTLSVNTTTYVVTAQLKDQDGNDIGTAQTIDLPLESVVVNGSYDSTNKKIVLTLQNGTTIDIPVADLVSGLQSTIDAQHPLNADYLTSGTTNKVYTATEQSKLSGIEAGAQVNVKPDWNAAAGTAAEILNKPTIPAAQVNSDWNAVSGAAQILNKPSIPANTSDLNNDSGFITINDVPAAVQADWTESDSTDPAYIQHKPSIPANTSDLNNDSGFITINDVPSQVNADWNAVSGAAQILNKPTIPAAQVNSDWNATSGKAEILNKPSIPTATSELNNDSGFITGSDVPSNQTQANWNESDSTKPGYINNKPTIPAAQVNADWNASSGVAQILNKPTIPAAQVNSDWNATSGKAEILNKPTIPSKTSDLNNDSGFITSSDIPAQVNADWNAVSGAAQILNKPSIPAAQVNSDWAAASGVAQILNKPTIPSKTSDLNNDSGFITSSDIPAQVNADWNAVSGAAQILNKPSIPAAQVNSDWAAASGVAQILNKPTIPANTSDLHNDSGFITANDVPAQQQADWDETDNTKPTYIANKPTIPAAQVNADWNAASGVSQILNKPTIPAAQVNSDWAAASGISQILNKPSTIAVVVTFTDQTTATYNLYHS